MTHDPPPLSVLICPSDAFYRNPKTRFIQSLAIDGDKSWHYARTGFFEDGGELRIRGYWDDKDQFIHRTRTVKIEDLTEIAPYVDPDTGEEFPREVPLQSHIYLNMSGTYLNGPAVHDRSTMNGTDLREELFMSSTTQIKMRNMKDANGWQRVRPAPTKKTVKPKRTTGIAHMTIDTGTVPFEPLEVPFAVADRARTAEEQDFQRRQHRRMEQLVDNINEDNERLLRRRRNLAREGIAAEPGEIPRWRTAGTEG
jgi:hypothetical protein